MSYEALPTAACPGCGEVGRVSRVTALVMETVCDRDVEVSKVTRACAGCGAEWENTKDPDWRVEAYAKLGFPPGRVGRFTREEFDHRVAQARAERALRKKIVEAMTEAEASGWQEYDSIEDLFAEIDRKIAARRQA